MNSPTSSSSSTPSKAHVEVPLLKHILTYPFEKSIGFYRGRMVQQQQENNSSPHLQKCLPKRIIIVRHGESQGNRDGSAYTTTPDHQIPLTQKGIAEARRAGEKIRRVISDEGRCRNWKVYFYVSPYDRTLSTLREIGKSFPRKRIIGVREECRVREQDFGNFQEEQRMKVIKETRERFGRFFYRFPEGESAADVYDRVSSKFFDDAHVLCFHISAGIVSKFLDTNINSSNNTDASSRESLDAY